MAVAQFENFMLGRSLSGPFNAKTQNFFFFLRVLASLRFFANWATTGDHSIDLGLLCLSADYADEERNNPWKST